MSGLSEARALPHNLEAERAVLGAMLVNTQMVVPVLALLTPDDFYCDVHRWLFTVMARLFARKVAIDFVTVCEELAPHQLEEIRRSYITGLIDGMPLSTNAEDYARIVREHADRRRLVLTARKLEALVFEGDRSHADVLDAAQQELRALTERQTARGFVSIDAVLRTQTMPILERAFATRTGITGISTEFTDLDHFLRGLQPGDLYLFGARSSTGKTSLATEMIRHVAVRCALPVGFFSLEMSSGAIGCRFLIAEARVDGHRLMGGLLPGDEWRRISEAMNTLAGAPIYIDDTSTITVAEMRARARRLQAEHGLKLLVIDYVQLMNGTGRSETRNLELAAISRGLKALAKELDMPIVVLSQLNRATESRPGGRPQLSDLRDCGALEQDADVVLLLHREELYQPTDDNRGIVEVIIAKHRNGPTGSVRLRWVAREMRFENLNGQTLPSPPTSLSPGSGTGRRANVDRSGERVERTPYAQ